jgi:thiol:disulfide interchange protein DsbD
VRHEVLRPLAIAALAVGAPALAGCAAAAPPPVTLQIASAPAVAPAGVVEASRRTERAPIVAPAGAIAWETSEREARERARRGGLPLLVFARASWSAGSLEMERKAWVDPRVVAAARRFVALRLDLTDAEGDAELHAQRYDLTAVPMTVLFDARGRKVAARAGWIEPAALEADLLEAAQ